MRRALSAGHAQLDLGRVSVWTGIDTSVVALAVFCGYLSESDSFRVSLSLGPFYIGGGVSA